MNDTDRLRFLMASANSVYFYGLPFDHAGYTAQYAAEQEHETPTPEDELEGYRRMIDAAAALQNFV